MAVVGDCEPNSYTFRYAPSLKFSTGLADLQRMKRWAI
jgi:hypothetical protein